MFEKSQPARTRKLCPRVIKPAIESLPRNVRREPGLPNQLKEGSADASKDGACTILTIVGRLMKYLL